MTTADYQAALDLLVKREPTAMVFQRDHMRVEARVAADNGQRLPQLEATVRALSESIARCAS